MVSFIDAHRAMYGARADLPGTADRPIHHHAHVARRMEPTRRSARASAGTTCFDRRCAACSRRISASMASARSGGRCAARGSTSPDAPLPVDAGDGLGRRDPRQAGAHHRQRQGGTMPARSGERQFRAPAPNTAVGVGTLPTWRPGPGSSTWRSSSTPMPVGSSAGGPAGAPMPARLDALEQALHDRRPARGAWPCPPLGPRQPVRCPSNTPKASQKQASSPPSVSVETAMTMPWRDDQRPVQG